MTTMDRRGFVRAMPGLLMAPRLFAQTAGASLRIRNLNHVALVVSDLQRSIDFYQGLFGAPVATRQGAGAAALQVGFAPQRLELTTNDASENRTAKIDHLCLGVDDFDVNTVQRVLAAHGVSRSDQRGPMRVQVRMRGADARGASQGTPEVYICDPDGIIVQLQDPTYCGGSGPRGNVCSAPEPTTTKGLIALKGYSHCTVYATDAQRSNAFYRELFGMTIRSYQGPAAPTLAVGPSVEFLMFTGGGAAARSASINHFCMNVENFDAARIVSTLESYGIRPRESQTAPAGPMRHYITMRMENRGAAAEGTPELYFTDPDGILVQLQDVSYCGGAGVLGNVCP